MEQRVFQAYAGKFGGTFARLLLTMHAIENCPGWAFNEGLEKRERLKVVGEETARRTFEIMTRFLIPHAIRQYERLGATASISFGVPDDRDQGEAVWQGQIDAPSSSVPSLDVLATGSSERDIARRSIHDR